MISRFDIEARVREWGLREDVVEKDYVLGWVLWGIGTEDALVTSWTFKGGTCLKKCYLETYRFSEDLDFTVLPDGPVLAEAVRPALERVLARVHEHSGIAFDERPTRLKTHASGRYTEGRVYYRGPRNAPTVASIRLDLSASETVARPTVLRRIAHGYPDGLPEPGIVRCYSFEELFAEKLRAMGERSRPRDLYDIVNLFRRRDLRAHGELVRQVLEEKCSSKNVPVPTLEALESSPHRSELETEWANMLSHQLPELPPFATFWSELPSLFRWLDGGLSTETLELIPGQGGTDQSWAPPATLWTWGQGVPVEAIRFAAANHLCIDLGYQGSVRRVEPYSLRRTKDGHLLLFALKVETRETRGYRLDRIESIRVTPQPFHPVYLVEIGSSGPLSTPPLRRSRRAT